MLKNGLKNMPVITIHINPSDKQALQSKADEKSMQLATYCRMVLLNSLHEVK